MASDAYWNATKPNGMPDHVWKAQQEAKKAEEEAKKKAEEAKKAEEEAAKKKAEADKKNTTSSNNPSNSLSVAEIAALELLNQSVLNGKLPSSGSGLVPTTQDILTNGFVGSTINAGVAAQGAAKGTSSSTKNGSSSTTSKPNGTSTNDARAEQLGIKNNTTPDYSKDYTGNANNTNSSSTTTTTTPNRDNVGLTTSDAKAEQIANKNNTTPDYSKDYTGNSNNTNNAGKDAPKTDTGTANDIAWGIISSKPLAEYNTADLEAAKGYDRNVSSEESKKNNSSNNTNSSSKPKVDNTGLTTEDARDEKIATENGTVPDYTKKDNGYVPVSDLNKPTNGSGEKPKVDNSGLTTEDARKEHTTIMNDPAINNPTDGEISAGGKPVSKPEGGEKPKEDSTKDLLNQISDLIQNNTPTVDKYIPTDYVAGTYTPLTQGSSTLNTTSEEVAKYALAIMQAARGELGEVVKPEYTQAVAPTSPELRTLEELAKTYGITYDYDSIYKVLNDSVEKQYDAIYERQKQNEATYYDNATAAQNTLLDTLSRDRSSAVQAGVSKGMQAANALGAMLGVSQQFAGNATALSQERGNTAKDYGAALAKAVVDAERTSNERKNAIMEISKMLYGYDSEQYVANMDNYNTILTNNAGLQQTYMNNQTALQNALASIYNNSASNKIAGDASIQASQATAEANRLAAQYAAEAQRYAAYQTAEANKVAAVSAAQGNIDAYKEYANALIASAAINANATNKAFENNEIPQNGTGTGTTNTSANGGTTNVGNSDLTKIYDTVKGAADASTQHMYTNKDMLSALDTILKGYGIIK